MDPLTVAVTGTLPISGYLEYFEPIPLATPAMTITVPSSITSGILEMFLQAGPYGTTLVQWGTTNSIITGFFALGFALLALIFLINFVMRHLRLGRVYSRNVIARYSKRYRSSAGAMERRLAARSERDKG